MNRSFHVRMNIATDVARNRSFHVRMNIATDAISFSVVCLEVAAHVERCSKVCLEEHPCGDDAAQQVMHDALRHRCHSYSAWSVEGSDPFHTEVNTGQVVRRPTTGRAHTMDSISSCQYPRPENRNIRLNTRRSERRCTGAGVLGPVGLDDLRRFRPQEVP